MLAMDEPVNGFDVFACPVLTVLYGNTWGGWHFGLFFVVCNAPSACLVNVCARVNLFSWKDADDNVGKG